MHGDTFRLCLQQSSGQLIVQNRYKMVPIRYGIRSRIVWAPFVPDLYYTLV